MAEPSPVNLHAPTRGVAGAAAAHGERRAERSRVSAHAEGLQARTLASRTGAAEVPAALAPEPAPEGVAVPVGPPQWQTLADSGLYAEAMAHIERTGGYELVSRDASAEQLMLLVDVARATGQRARAIQALRRIVNQHGTDPNAPVAAWMLGNELTKAGDSAGASQAFAMYRALSPQGDFAEDALARQFEAAMEQGDLDQAGRLAEQYARDFPEGRRGDDMQARLAELVAARAAARDLAAQQAQPAAGSSSQRPAGAESPAGAASPAGESPAVGASDAGVSSGARALPPSSR